MVVAPLAARPARGAVERRFERRRRVDLERAQRDAGQAELRLDHLALFGDAQRAVDRTRRLRLDRQVGRPAAAADAAAAAVEQRDRHAVVAARRDDRFLRLVELPGGGEPADVLGRIGVADHHFLAALVAHHAVAVPGNRQQPVHHVRGGAQIARRLEQRHDPQRPRDAGFALQQLHREHVGGPAGLGDDVGAERIARHLRDGAERVEDVGDRRLRAHAVGAEHALLRQDVQQEIDAPLFVPLGVVAEALVPGDGVDRLGVSADFLADVEPDQRQPERGHAAQHVGQPAVGDQIAADGAQRGVAEAQRFRELFVARRAGRRRSSGRAASVSSASTSRTVASSRRCRSRSTARYGSCAPCGASQQLGARARHRQLEAEHLDLARVQRQRRPARHQARAPRDVGRHRRVAVAIAADPRAEADRRGVERQASVQRSGAASGRAIGSNSRHGVPERLLEHRHAPSGLRRAATAVRAAPPRCPRRRRSRGASTRAAPRARVGVRSGRSSPASAAAMRLYLCCSVRRMISVGCAVITSSMRRPQTASNSASGDTPVPSSRGSASSIEAGCGRPPGSRSSSRRRRTR